MNRNKYWIWLVVASAFLLVIAGALVVVLADNSLDSAPAVTRSTTVLAQDGGPSNPQYIAVPEALERISWGAVIAGAVIALVGQMVLNLLGISIGATAIAPERGEDNADAKEIGVGAAVWVSISALLALFFGGWVAARFAGQPDETDAMLHGLMVWGVATLTSVVLLTTAVGRIVSGISSMIGEGLQLAGRAASATAQGVATVATGAAGVAGQAVQGAAGAGQEALQDRPEVREAVRRVDMAMDTIRNEARQMFSQAGLSSGQVRQEARQAGEEVRNLAEQAARNPDQAGQQFDQAIQRIMQSGKNMADRADRDTVIQAMMTQGNMTEADARRTLQSWEDNYARAQQELTRVQDQAMQKMQQIQQDVKQKASQVKRDAQETAREAAETSSKAIAKLAGAVFIALVLGAFAAGIGGVVGAPDSVEVANVEAHLDGG